MYVAGTALFAAASLACGLAPGAGALVAMRAVQGVGATAMFATTLSLLGAAYQGRDRSVALGVWGAVSGAAAALGPVLGGLLTQALDWRWIFYVNLPVSVAAIALTLRVVKESRGHGGARIDWPGTASFTAFAGLLTFAVIRADEQAGPRPVRHGRSAARWRRWWCSWRWNGAPHSRCWIWRCSATPPSPRS